MRGFYPGHSFDRNNIELQAREDAQGVDPSLSFEKLCKIALRRAKRYYTVYTDNPKLLYETYVNAFVHAVISTSQVWEYTEES